jgi:uncharacterized membrane protein
VLYGITGSVLIVLGVVLAILTIWRMTSGVLFVDTALLSISVIVIGAIAIYLGRTFGKTSNPEESLGFASEKQEDTDAHSH